MKNEIKLWKAVLTATPKCVPVERFAGTLDEGELAHVAECPRCQTERALWLSFEQNQPAVEDGAAVRWIAAELQRRVGPAEQPPPRRVVRWLPGWRTAAATCTFAMAFTAALFVWQHSETALPELHSTGPVYRSQGVTVEAPTGDLASAPAALQWHMFPGAHQYRVQVMEVDQNVLWTGAASGTSIPIPASVRAVALPGKTLLWQVTALNTAGSAIGSSSVQRFRIRTKPIPNGE